MQLRPWFIALAAGMLLASVAASASAQQIYKWKDAQGVTHFSQTPPPTGTHYTKMHLTGASAVSHDSPTHASNTEAQPQSHEDSVPPLHTNSKPSTQPDTASNRAKMCKQLSSNIALLQSKQPVVLKGGNGKQEVMSDNTRDKQLATARAQQAKYCSAS